MVGRKKKYDFASNYGESTIQVKVKVCAILDSIMKNQANFFLKLKTRHKPSCLIFASKTRSNENEKGKR